MPPLCKGRWHRKVTEGLLKHPFFLNINQLAKSEFELHQIPVCGSLSLTAAPTIICRGS